MVAGIGGMTTQIDFWELFAGLILFLFAMSQLESALNVNREILISNRALVVALAYHHLGEQQAEDIALMPRPVATRLG